MAFAIASWPAGVDRDYYDYVLVHGNFDPFAPHLGPGWQLLSSSRAVGPLPEDRM